MSNVTVANTTKRDPNSEAEARFERKFKQQLKRFGAVYDGEVPGNVIHLTVYADENGKGVVDDWEVGCYYTPQAKIVEEKAEEPAEEYSEEVW